MRNFIKQKRVRNSVLLALILGCSIAVAQVAANNYTWSTWQSPDAKNKGSFVSKAMWHVKLDLLQGLIALSNMRDDLFALCLKDPYLQRPTAVACYAGTQNFRSADGSCNDLNDTRMGQAGLNVRFGRNLKDWSKGFPEPDQTKLLTPNPRQISDDLMARPDNDPDYEPGYDYFTNKGINLWAAVWIQFMVHDWVSHGDNRSASDNPFLLPDPKNPSANPMIIPRTRTDQTRTANEKGIPPTYVNEVSPWWDGGQIYGSNIAAQQELRAPVGSMKSANGKVLLGRMRVESYDPSNPETEHLPVDSQFMRSGFGIIGSSNGKELTGFSRNWWVGLSLMHTLFVREHNYVAGVLQNAHPDWNDERVFQTARLVVVAEMAKIHTLEWTPGILHHPTLDKGMRMVWYGLSGLARDDNSIYMKTLNLTKNFLNLPTPLPPQIANQLTLAKGTVGMKTPDMHNSPYSLTEEFTSVYRLHSLLPETLQVNVGGGNIERVPVVETRENSSPDIIKKYSASNLLRTFGTQHAGALTFQNYPRFLRNLQLPKPLDDLTFDMGAVDIMRDRERGVPRYNEFRRQLLLQPMKSFEDLMPQDSERNVAYTKKLKEIYNGDIEALDLLPGSLAEGYRPEGYGFGQTIFQLFLITASRRLQSDRFFTTDFTPAVYSKEGMNIIDGASMAVLIRRNYPSLQPYIKDTDNAFAPWQSQN